MIKKLLILASLLVPTALMADTGDINLSSNFQENSGRPLDARIVTASSTTRAAMTSNQVYNGMMVFQKDNSHTYQLQGSTFNWVDLGILSSVANTVLQPTGLAFGSGTSTAATDASHLNYSSTTQTQSIYNIQTDPGFGTYYPNLELKKIAGNKGCQYWDDDSGNARGVSMCYKSGNLDIGQVSGIGGLTGFTTPFIRIHTESSFPAGSSTTINGSFVLGTGYNANQLLETDANNRVTNYDLFNTSPTYNGQGNWTSAQPSTFTAIAVSSLALSGAGVGITVSTSVTINGALNLTGSGNASITENGVTGQIVLSTNVPTAGQGAVWQSSFTLGPGSVGGTPSGPAWSVQVSSAGTLGGFSNLTNTGSTVTVSGINKEVVTNVSTVTATGVPFIYTGSTITISAIQWPNGMQTGAGSSPGGSAYQVQYASANGTSFAGSPNFTNNGTTITVSGINTEVVSNVSTITATGVYFDYTTSTGTIMNTTLAKLRTWIPKNLGEQFFVTDAVNTPVCYSSGTTTLFAVESSTKGICN